MTALIERGPPELEPGVTVDSLTTVDACDVALDRLTIAIAQIERQLKTTPRNSANQPAGWRANAEAALRIKKFLMPRVQERRGVLKRESRQARQEADVVASRTARLTKQRALLSIVREIAPEVMSRADLIAQDRFPELFTGGEAA